MSTDLLPYPYPVRAYPRNPGALTRLASSVPGPVRNIVVIFGGWGSDAAGLPLGPGQPTGTSKLLKKVQALGNLPFGTLHVAAFEGSLVGGIDSAAVFIRSLFHPLGRLIIYGYSAGGLDAMSLARVISTWTYNFTTRRLVSCGILSPSQCFSPPSSTPPDVGVVRVDLLLTVDAADGPMSGIVFRDIARSVRRNINLYQTYPASRPRSGGATASGVLSHGGPNFAVSPTATVIENYDLTGWYTADPGQGHGRIDNDTNEAAFEAIRGTLTYGGPPLLPLSGMMALNADITRFLQFPRTPLNADTTRYLQLHK